MSLNLVSLAVDFSAIFDSNKWTKYAGVCTD